jgi:hypothetical protein
MSVWCKRGVNMVFSSFFILVFCLFFFLFFISCPFWRPPWQHAPGAARPLRPSLGTPLAYGVKRLNPFPVSLDLRPFGPFSMLRTSQRSKWLPRGQNPHARSLHDVLSCNAASACCWCPVFYCWGARAGTRRQEIMMASDSRADRKRTGSQCW